MDTTLADAQEPKGIVTPRGGPLAPPRIPTRRRVARGLLRFWPLAAWCGAVTAAAALYTNAAGHGHALACEGAREVRIAPALAGRIATLDVAMDQIVRAGDLIATLDSRDVDARLHLARSELDRSRTRVEAEREALRLEQADRRAQAQSRRNTYQTEGRRLRGIAESHETAQTTDRAELDALNPQIERLKPLLEKKLTTADRVEELVQRQAVLEGRLASGTDEMRRAREELSAWQALEPEELPNADIGATLLPFEMALKSEEARVAEFELQREKCRITAPADGTVSLILVRPGEWRGEGEEIAHLVAPGTGRVDAYVTDRQMSAVPRGTRAKLRSRDLSGPPLDGTVESVGPLVEEVPIRLRAVPTLPQWGRRITIAVEGLRDSLPGAVYEVRFY